MKKRGFDPSKAESMSLSEVGTYLDERERKFATEYLIDRNGTQAAIRAGYKPGKNNASARVQGSRLVNDPRIIAYRRKLLAAQLDQKDMNKDNIVLRLAEVVDRCMAKEPVMQWNSDTHQYEESGEWQFNAKGAISGLSEIAKLLGMYTEKHEIEAGESLESFLAGISGKEM